MTSLFSSVGLKQTIQKSPKDLRTSWLDTQKTETSKMTKFEKLSETINNLSATGGEPLYTKKQIMKNRIDEIMAHLNCAAVDGGFCLFVKDGEIVAKDLLHNPDEPRDTLEFNVRFVGTDISDIEAKPLTKK